MIFGDSLRFFVVLGGFSRFLLFLGALVLVLVGPWCFCGFWLFVLVFGGFYSS